MKVLYVLPTGTMYGDNIALLSIVPTLESFGVTPIFLLLEGSPIEKEVAQRNYQYLPYKELRYSVYDIGRTKITSVLRVLRYELTRNHSARKREFKGLVAKIKTLSIDIIHTNCSTSYLGVDLAQTIGIPHIQHFREYGDLDARVWYWPTKKRYLRRLYNAGSFCIAITESIRHYHRLPEETSSSIYDGVFSLNTPYQLQTQKDNYFLYVGRVAIQKGVVEVLNAFADFCKYDDACYLYIVGDGDAAYLSLIKKLVIERDISDRVRFLGYRKDVPSLMQTARAVVVGSYHEAFGFITAEAIFNGCPVIGRDTAGTREQFDNISLLSDGNEIIYRYTENSDIMHGFQKFSAMQFSLEQLQNFHDKVYDLYSVEKSAQKVFELYKKIALNYDKE